MSETDTATTTVCIYCGHEHAGDDARTPVPSLHDDAAWSALASEHLGTCEWVLTRAHRRDIPQSQRKTRIITLTDRPPVKIVEDEWPVIASASGDSYTGSDYARRPQAESRGEIDQHKIIVREHADGRRLVYGIVSAAIAAWGQPARGHDWRGGVVLPTGCDARDTVDAIKSVGQSMIEHGCDEAVIRECIADLPAETL